MDNLRYLSIDAGPSAWVLASCAGAALVLYCVEMWARRRTQERTRAVIEACDRERTPAT